MPQSFELSGCPGESLWQYEHVAGGLLLTDASEAAREGVDLLHALAEGSVAPETLPLLSTIGTHADVYRLGDLAVKVYGKRHSSHVDGASVSASLQASAMLHDGLRHVPPQPVPPTRKRPGGTIIYSAPRMYGSFILSDRRSGRRPITVMSYEEGVESQNWKGPQPSYRARRNICRAAVEYAGLPGRNLILDKNPENVLFRPIDESVSHLVQLDVMNRKRRPHRL
jgi:hypothetical protein